MVETNVMDVLPDGTITEMELVVNKVLIIRFKRGNKDGRFVVESANVLSSSMDVLKHALQSILISLKDHGETEIDVREFSDSVVSFTV